ncbi:MAG: helix-turn-helix transcriptional regulator [Cystobacter sp.]
MDDDILQKTIGAAARRVREGLKLTQGQVAAKAGIAAQVYGRIERGGMMPSVPTLRKIAAALGAEPGELLGMTADEVPTSGRGLSRETGRALGIMRRWPEAKIGAACELLHAFDRVPVRED